MGIEIEGLDELEDQIRKLADLEGGVPMVELFDEEFMLMYTDFTSFDEMLEQSKWQVESQEDFEAIPDDEFDIYVSEYSEFPDWETMMETGSSRYFEKKLS